MELYTLETHLFMGLSGVEGYFAFENKTQKRISVAYTIITLRVHPRLSAVHRTGQKSTLVCGRASGVNQAVHLGFVWWGLLQGRRKVLQRLEDLC